MADFSKRSDFNPKAKFTSVLFGANAPLLEIELNEMQQIAEQKRAEIIRLLTKAEGDKTAYIAREQVDAFTSNLTNTITIPKFHIFFKNQIVDVPAGNYSVPSLVSLVNNNAGSYEDLYLAYKEEVANPATALNENAVRGATAITNNILDTRFGTETSRRTLIKFGGIGSATSLATPVSEGYTLLKLLKIQKVNSKLVYTPYADIGYYTLTSYALVGANGNPYPETSDLNNTNLISGFHVSSLATLNKPTADTGIALVLNNEITRMTIFFTDTGRIFIRNTTLSPVFSAGTWNEISPSDLDGEVRATALTGIVFTNGTDITASDSMLTAFGKLQKQNTDNKGTANTHINSTANPHSVSKAQVGLGSVLNYGVATQAEAEAGTSDAKYMTPLRVAQATLHYQAKIDAKAPLAHNHAIADVTGLQTALNGKQATVTGGATSVLTANLTANRALASDASGKITQSAVTATELGYLSGVTSSLQTQLSLKSDIAHNHDVNSLNGMNVDSPAYGEILYHTSFGWTNMTFEEANIAQKVHAHAIGDITGLQNTLNSKQATITGGATSIASANLTASRVLVSDTSGKVAVSAVTPTELGYLTGVTSSLQTQINSKAPTSHSHGIADITALQTALDGKASSTHNHTLDSLSNTTITSNTSGEILAWNGTAWINRTLAEAGIAPATHAHAIADITNLQGNLDNKQATITGGATTITSTNLTASRALVSDSSGKVDVSLVTSTELSYLDGVTSAIQTQLNGKAPSSHNHAIADVTGLQTALNGKAPTSHTHTKAQITDFPTSMPASDVYSWAKASTKPSYTYSEVGAAASSHTHSYLPLTGGTISSALTVSGLTTATGGLKIGSYRLTISTSAPSSPATGDIWIDI